LSLAPVALVTLLAWASAFAQPRIDYVRENRWAAEVEPAIVVGEALRLQVPGGPRFLAILAQPSGTPKGAVVVVHGLGVHPDWGLIGELRTRLADAGFTTLAIQMPVLGADAARADYRVTLPEAGERILAAIGYLRGRGATKLAIVSHSYGATMVDALLAQPAAPRIDAWAPIGMLADFGVPPKEPELDVVAAGDLPEVIASAPKRKARLPKDACSGAVTIAGTDHYFANAPQPLAEAVVKFLEQVFAGRC
jgi:alpha/beta superfamily hydrolase